MTPSNTSRRNFLRSGAVLAAGATAATPALAISPLPRNGRPQFRLSLAGYSFRKYMDKGKGPMSLLDFAEFAARLGLDAIEPTSYYFPTPLSRDFVLELKHRCHLLGLDISGVPVGNKFTLPPGEERQKQIQHVKTWIDWAALLGAPTIRVFAGSAPKGVEIQQARAWCIETMREALDYAGEKGVFLALENHGGIVATPDDLLTIVHAIDHPWFGVNLDTGNFHGEDPYEDLMRCAPYAVMVQFKVNLKPKDGPVQAADFNRILKIMDAVDYRGYIALEYEAKPEPKTAVPNIIREMQEALARRG